MTQRRSMPKTLSTRDPNLLASVGRLRRAQQLWGVLLIALGVLTELAATSAHPVAGLPFIAIGLLAFRWAEPALLATVATLVAFSIVPTINPRITILGPDPLTSVASLSLVELVAYVIGKSLIVLTAANQFFLYRFLYGSEQATSDDPTQAIIPPMVPNRTDGLARWARALALTGLAGAVAALALSAVGPAGFTPQLLAEIAGSLVVVAVGLGLGSAFSPTDERQAALTGVGLGVLAYTIAAVALLNVVH